MADSKPKIAIPDWQRAKVEMKEQATSKPTADQPTETATSNAETPAPSGDTSSSSTAAPTAGVLESGEVEVSKPVGEQEVVVSPAQQPQQPQQQVVAARPQTSTAPVQPRPTGPPIITYPEFLVQAHQPPPLITPTRVINSLYLAAGAATVLYGASRYIIEPMVERLTAARHEYLTHSNSRLDEFNDRLSKIVSKIPPPPSSRTDAALPIHTLPPDLDARSDTESAASDPTELFHRDMGTQTSPGTTRPPSDASSDDREGRVPPTAADRVGHQAAHLSTLGRRLQELADDAARVGRGQSETQVSAVQLRNFLDGMIYSGSGMHAFSGVVDAAGVGGKASGLPSTESDPIEQLKREIRGVKGVLLSAKRFPAAGGRARQDLAFDAV